MGKTHKPLTLLVDTHQMSLEELDEIAALEEQGHNINYLETWLKEDFDGLISHRSWNMPVTTKHAEAKYFLALVIKGMREKVYKPTPPITKRKGKKDEQKQERLF